MIIISNTAIIAVIICVLLQLVAGFISNNTINHTNREENRRYECGFEQNTIARIPISIRYFMLTLVFLVFDIEIILLVFAPIELFMGSGLIVRLVSILFIILLFIGLLIEWYDGALEWIISTNLLKYKQLGSCPRNIQ